MDDVSKYAKTLDEIEGELMFGDIPDDLSDDHNIFDDEYDAANDETFGGIDDIAVDAELEDYAAQTARLRLDDPVWENPSSSTAAPDPSNIPMPFNMFGGLGSSSAAQVGGISSVNNFTPESPFLDKSIWGNTGDKSFNIWGSDFGMGNLNQTFAESVDYSKLMAEDEETNRRREEQKKPVGVPSGIPAMPSTALTLSDLENWNTKTDSSDGLSQQFSDMHLDKLVNTDHLPQPQYRKIVPQSAGISATVVEPNQFVTGEHIVQKKALPVVPPAAMSIEEVERQLLKEAEENTAKINTKQQQMLARELLRAPSRADSIVERGGPPGFQSHGPVPMQNPMAPPFPIPKLPPLAPQFLPLVPMWLQCIMQQSPPPMNFPPPPPFLIQLMQMYRNPAFVHMMIMQSSIPPHLRMHQSMPPPSGPHSPMVKHVRKQPGMPSSRTIHDLALDSFAGFMSWKEREWLVRIQLMQCKGSGDPLIEDYYYTTWRDKQIANGYRPVSKSETESLPTETKAETKQDYMERIQRMNYREKQKERARDREKERQRERKERAERGEEKKPKLTLSDKFATSLGLPSKSSTQNPRHVLDMKQQVDSAEHNLVKRMTDEERKIAIAKKLRTMLLRLESAIGMLLEIDELKQASLNERSRFKALNGEEKEQEIDRRTTTIINELMGDDLSKLLQMAKGRTVIVRLLNNVTPKEQARIILALFSAGGLVNKKYYGEIVTELLPTVYQKLSSLHPEQFFVLVQAINIDVLKRQLLDSNMFIRDMMLTIFLISLRNGQPMLEWAKATKFPSLVMPSACHLDYWKRALKCVSNAEMSTFEEEIQYSGIVDCKELAQLLSSSS